MDENMFDLGLDVATISAELSDPVITLSGADSYTVQDTADYPLLALSVYGKSTQGYASHGGTPLGKNLANNTLNFNQNTTSYQVDNGIMTVIGGTKAWSGAAVTLSDKLIIGQTYTVSFNITGMASGYLLISNAGKGWQAVWDSYIKQWEKPSDGKVVFTFIAGTSTAIISINISLATTLSSDVTVNITDIQLEKGSTATTYEPYYSNPNPDCPVDIVSVGDDGSINVVSCGGTNFLEGQLLGYGTWNEYGQPVEMTTAIKTTNRTYLEAGTYIISTQNAKRGVGYKYSSATADTGTRIFDWGDNNIPQIFTLTESAYCAFAFNNVPGTGDIKLEDVTDLKMQVCSMAEITSGLPLCSIGDVRDELIYNADGTGKIIKRTGLIILDGSADEGWQISENAYFLLPGVAGNLLSPNAISTVGIVSHTQLYSGYGLALAYGVRLRFEQLNPNNNTIAELKAYLADNPITVVYQLATPQEIELSATEMAELQKLQSYEGTTSIYNDEQAEMLVKMLRSDYDMKYIDWLKESQTWTCPKAGKWKVICVGGGASGGLYDSTENAVKLTPTTAGGTTSFGSIIAANGAPSTSDYGLHGYATQKAGVSGYGGYTGTSYGGVPMTGAVAINTEFGAAGGTGNAAVHASGNPGSAVGYGAGGGAASLSAELSVIAGRAGSIESTIVDLDEGQTIMCTVGKGGQTTDPATMGSGADGVIVVQYLGY